MRVQDRKERSGAVYGGAVGGRRATYVGGQPTRAWLERRLAKANHRGGG